jgi:hypothetical protein
MRRIDSPYRKVVFCGGKGSLEMIGSDGQESCPAAGRRSHDASFSFGLPASMALRSLCAKASGPSRQVRPGMFGTLWPSIMKITPSREEQERLSTLVLID